MSYSEIRSRLEEADTTLLHMYQTMQFAICALQTPDCEDLDDYAESLLCLLRDATQDVRAKLDEIDGGVLSLGKGGAA